MSSICTPCSCTSVDETRPTTADASTGAARRPTRIFHPQADAYVSSGGDQAVVVLDMPGCRRDGIEVSFDRGVLTIRGQVKPRRPEGEGWTARLEEFAVGDYYRAFRVDFPVDASGITAEYANGVLTVRVPKHEAARQRRVPVTAG